MKAGVLGGDLEDSSLIFKSCMLHVSSGNSCFCMIHAMNRKFWVMKDKRETDCPSIEKNSNFTLTHFKERQVFTWSILWGSLLPHKIGICGLSSDIHSWTQVSPHRSFLTQPTGTATTNCPEVTLREVLFSSTSLDIWEKHTLCHLCRIAPKSSWKDLKFQLCK